MLMLEGDTAGERPDPAQGCGHRASNEPLCTRLPAWLEATSALLLSLPEQPGPKSSDVWGPGSLSLSVSCEESQRLGAQWSWQMSRDRAAQPYPWRRPWEGVVGMVKGQDGRVQRASYHQAPQNVGPRGNLSDRLPDRHVPPPPSVIMCDKDPCCLIPHVPLQPSSPLTCLHGGSPVSFVRQRTPRPCSLLLGTA